MIEDTARVYAKVETRSALEYSAVGVRLYRVPAVYNCKKTAGGIRHVHSTACNVVHHYGDAIGSCSAALEL